VSGVEAQDNPRLRRLLLINSIWIHSLGGSEYGGRTNQQ
jgi:hypothetical protein